MFADSLKVGALAGVATTAAVAALSRRETGSASAGLNAVSHIAWGDRAARQQDPSLKYTLTGLALNAAAVTGWALVQDMLFNRRRGLARSVAAGTATAALAYVVDYHMVPERFTPGFEKRLSGPALAAVYGVLAASLAAGAALREKHHAG
jgi:hypothetical protein